MHLDLPSRRLKDERPFSLDILSEPPRLLVDTLEDGGLDKIFD